MNFTLCQLHYFIQNIEIQCITKYQLDKTKFNQNLGKLLNRWVSGQPLFTNMSAPRKVAHLFKIILKTRSENKEE